ncbi:MAG: type VI secretion system-associated protein VasI [Pseudomonadota bacterium]
MMIRTCLYRRVLPALWLVGAALSVAPALAGPLEQAQRCTEQPQRLERLACFDDIFGTPMDVTGVSADSQSARPPRWQQAYAQEQERTPGDGPLYSNTGDTAGHLVTLAALGTEPPRPVLALQCHNNITELSLMLPDPLDAERLRLGFGGSEDLWRVRDNGFVLSGGRGLPAIRVARALADRTDAHITSSHAAVDGLMFDLDGFRQAIGPLRAECGW